MLGSAADSAPRCLCMLVCRWSLTWMPTAPRFPCQCQRSQGRGWIHRAGVGVLGRFGGTRMQNSRNVTCAISEVVFKGLGSRPFILNGAVRSLRLQARLGARSRRLRSRGSRLGARYTKTSGPTLEARGPRFLAVYLQARARGSRLVGQIRGSWARFGDRCQIFGLQNLQLYL